MRAGVFPKQEKCNRTDSVEGKNNKAGGTKQHEMECFGILVSIKQSLGSPGEFRGNMSLVVSIPFLCLAVN